MPFITVEGIEGCGKSTQARRLAEAVGPKALLTVEPGATELGGAIRTLLLEQRSREVSPLAELLLFFADRAQHVHEVVRPALASGRTVISDRYADSTTAYQGYGRGLSLDLIRTLTTHATGGLAPDLTLLLDLPVEVGLARARRRGAADRMESEDVGFHERVRQGYLKLATENPARWVVIDATGSEDDVAARIRTAVAARGIELTDAVR
jgi:dTMP kinase